MSDGDTITAALFNNEYNQLVNAFTYSSSSASSTGHRHDGTAGHGGNIHTIGDLDFLNKIVADSTNNRWGIFVEVSSAAVEQIRIQDGAIVPVTDNDIDLGTSSLEFKDAYFDGTVTSDAFAGPLTGDVTGNVSGTAATVTTAAQSNITSLGTLTTLTVDNVIINGTTIGHTSDTDLMTLTSGVLTVAGELDAATLDISGNADIDGTLEADAITVDGTALNEYIADTVGAMVSSNTETNITVTYEDGDNTLDFVIGTLNQDTTGTADNITISANNSTDETVYPIFVDGATGSQGAESDTGFTYNPSSGLLTISGELDAGSLDISGNADIDGTLEADAYTVDGTALNEYIADTVGAMVSSNTETNITVTYEDGDNTLDFVIGTLNQDTTGTADNITVSANNSTDETVYPIFVDGATGSQGAESDTGLTYNPSTGMLTTTGVTATFTGNITGNVTGNTSGTAATVTGAAQSNITSLGTLTTLTVDNVIINGTTIGHTSDTDLITLADGNVTIAGELDLTTLDVSGNADIDGTLEADAITVDGTALNEYIADTIGAMVGSNTETGITVTYEDGDNTLDFVIGTLNQDTTGNAATFTASANNSTDETVYPVFVDGATGSQGAETDTGFTYNPSSGLLTIAGELDAGSLDISGNADIDGTANLDIVDIDGALTQDGGAVFNEDSADVDFRVESDGNANMLFVDGGNNRVGIGVADPTTALEIGETGGANLSLRRVDANTIIGEELGAIWFKADDPSASQSGGAIRAFAETGNWSSNSYPTAITFWNDVSGTSTERMRLNSSGNLGIGTNNPSEKLYIENSTDSTDVGMTIANTGSAGGEDALVNLYAHASGGDPVIRWNITGTEAWSMGIDNSDSDKLLISNGSTLPGTDYLAFSGNQILAGVSAMIEQQSITSSSNAVAWNAKTQANAYHVTTENTTFSAPSNATEGAIISVEIAQGGTARTIAWNTVFEFAASTAPTMTATANKTDIYSFRYNGSVWQEIGRVQNMAQT